MNVSVKASYTESCNIAIKQCAPFFARDIAETLLEQHFRKDVYEIWAGLLLRGGQKYFLVFWPKNTFLTETVCKVADSESYATSQNQRPAAIASAWK